MYNYKNNENIFTTSAPGFQYLVFNKKCLYCCLTYEVQPSMESLFRIADALNVNVRELLVSNMR
jgi:hypothetical protein